MELPPCPVCAGEPEDRCALCGRASAAKPLAFVRSKEWRRLHWTLSTGDTSVRRIAEHYGRDVEDVIAWLYPDYQRGRPVLV